MPINKVQKAPKTKSHLNWMGGKSYNIGNPIFNLRLIASSCFFGEPKYYDSQETTKSSSGHRIKLTDKQIENLRNSLDAIDPQEWRSLSPSAAMEKAIDAALDFDAEETLKEAARLRNEDFIRTTPQVILVRAAHHPKVKGTNLIRKYAREIIKRADEPAVQLAYHLSLDENAPIPNSLKRAWKDYLEGVSEYQLAKYRTESRVVKMVDVVNICHAKGDHIGKLMKGELKNNSNTWESIISKDGSTKENWERALDVMGHMALLRNIRNLSTSGVDTSLYKQKLIDGVREGKQLPFRYYSAYKANNGADPSLLDTIEECLNISIEHVPKFSGRVMSLCDNSGSARAATTSVMGTTKICDIANLTGVLTGMQSDEGYVGIFGDRLETFAVRKKSSIFDLADKADKIGNGIGHATEHGIWLFWDNAIKNKEHWDSVFVYSDMQAGHGGLYGDRSQYKDYIWGYQHIDVPKLIGEYRRTVNNKVNVFLVQVAGYSDTIIPEFYKNTYILGGWSPGVLRFAHSMIQATQ